MGLMDWLFPKPKSEPKITYQPQEFKLLTGYKPVFRDYYGNAYENLLIRSAIESKARHMSKLKFEIQGSAEFDLKTRMKYYPNRWMTYPQFFARCSTILDMTNNLFIVPVQNDRLETIGFFPVLPNQVKLVEDKKGRLWVKYEFSNGQVGAVEFDRCAYLVKHQYQSDFFGESNHAMKRTLDLIDIQEQAIEEAVKNSATIKFIAQVDNFTSHDDLVKERKRFNEYNFKGENSELLLFPYTYKDIKQANVQPYEVNEKQMELIESNVFNYFGTNTDVMQGKANSAQLDAFFNSEIEPFAIAMAEAMSKAIFTDKQRSFGNHVYINANRLQYMTIAEKVNMAQQLGDRGVLTINEMRELFNYTPLPDEVGNVAVIRGEYYAVDDKLGNQMQIINAAKGDSNEQIGQGA